MRQLLLFFIIFGFVHAENFTKNGIKAVHGCSRDRLFWERQDEVCRRKNKKLRFHCLEAIKSGAKFVEMCKQSVRVPEGHHPVYNEAEDAIKYRPCSEDTYQEDAEYSNEPLFYKCLSKKTFYSKGQLECGTPSTVKDRMFTCDYRKYYRFDDRRLTGCSHGLQSYCVLVSEQECNRKTHVLDQNFKCVNKQKDGTRDISTPHTVHTDGSGHVFSKDSKVHINIFLVCFMFLLGRVLVCVCLETTADLPVGKAEKSQVNSNATRAEFSTSLSENLDQTVEDNSKSDLGYSCTDSLLECNGFEPLTWPECDDEELLLPCSDDDDDLYHDSDDEGISEWEDKKHDDHKSIENNLPSQTLLTSNLHAIHYNGTQERSNSEYGIACTEDNQNTYETIKQKNTKCIHTDDKHTEGTKDDTPMDETILNEYKHDLETDPSSLDVYRKMFGPESDVPFVDSEYKSTEFESRTDICCYRCDSMPFQDINQTYSIHNRGNILETNEFTKLREWNGTPHVVKQKTDCHSRKESICIEQKLNKHVSKSSNSNAKHRTISLKRLKRLLNLVSYDTNQERSNSTLQIQPANIPQPTNIYRPQIQQNGENPRNESVQPGQQNNDPLVTSNNSNSSTSTNATSSDSNVTSDNSVETRSLASGSINGLLSHLNTGSENEALKYEWGRYRTFWSYPLDGLANPTNLARLGWYYEGNGDEVVCFSCKVKHSNWRIAEDINAVHARLSPHCPLVTGEDSGNIAIHGNSVNGRNATATAVDRSRLSELHQTACHSETESLSVLTRNLTVSGEHSRALSSVSIPQNVQITPRTPQHRACSEQLPSPQTTQQSSRTSGNLSSASTATSIIDSFQSPVQRNVFATQPTSTPAIFLQTSLNNNKTNQINQNPESEYTSSQQNGRDCSNQQQPSRTQASPGHQRTNAQMSSPTQQQINAIRRQAELMRQQQQNSPQDSLGINTERPRYPNYAVVSVREGTFQGFPSYLDQTPIQMAKAGFFYAGYSDYCRCFFCGGGLRNWECGDDPWVEHARWFPRCTFVKQNKGQVFINLVLQRQREMLLPNIPIPTEGQPELPQAGVPRDVDMQCSAVKHLEEMGYNTAIILRAVTQFREERGHSIPLTVEPLLDIVFNINVNKEEEQTPAPLDILPQVSNGYNLNWNTEDRKEHEPSSPERSSSNSTKTNGANFSADASKSDNRRNTVSSEKTPTKSRSASVSESEENEASASVVAEDSCLSVDELKSIQDENMQLKEQMKCKICMDNNVSIVFLPCGHFCSCAECAPALVRCPICRRIIKGSVKTYLV